MIPERAVAALGGSVQNYFPLKANEWADKEPSSLTSWGVTADTTATWESSHFNTSVTSGHRLLTGCCQGTTFNVTQRADVHERGGSEALPPPPKGPLFHTPTVFYPIAWLLLCC